ncbi:MAG: AAA family ATPase [Bacilli bacterium]|nr:AAA family ATPase [Bacilli bacterium]
MGRIISVANQKGGVGKTTTAINLSAALGSYGKKVLLIDFDSQGNSTRGLGLDYSALPLTIYDVCIKEADINSIIRPTSARNVDIAPSNLRLANLEAHLQSRAVRSPFSVLAEALANLKATYDFIVIDCPPSLGVLSLNALVVSTNVIVPIQCEFFAMEAVASMLSTINRVQKNYNPSLKIEGFLMTMYDSKTSMSNEVVAQIRSLFDENTFVTMIPRNVSLPEASFHGESVIDYRPSSSGAAAYLALAREVLENE